MRYIAYFVVLVLVIVDGVVINRLEEELRKVEARLPWCVADPRMDEAVVPEFEVEISLIKWSNYNNPDDGQYGEASWFLDPDLEITTCDVEAPMPGTVWGSKEMDTFGHEMLHCFIGDFHE
jgi:hypothetical protein